MTSINVPGRASGYGSDSCLQWLHAVSINAELDDFYRKHGFGNVGESRPRTVPVYTGCLLVPLPNIETRRRYLKYHDIHHLVTGYTVGRIGEGEMSAWELGTGSFFRYPILGVMNLIALSTGLCLDARRMWRAYSCGCRSRNLYSRLRRRDVDNGRWENVSQVRDAILETRAARMMPLRTLEFATYAGAAMIIHACLAIPAVVVRFISELLHGKSFIRAVKPQPRTDLF